MAASPKERLRGPRRFPARRDPGRTAGKIGLFPLYHQVEQLIRHRVAKNQYSPGSQIASENELCRELKVSRITVREALRELVREGLLVKVQGKGTFVSPDAALPLPPIKDTGALEDVYERVLRLKVVDVNISRVPVPAMLRQFLGVPPDETRTHVHQAAPPHQRGTVFVHGEFLPVSIGDRMRKEDLFTAPLMAILEGDMKIPIVRAVETVEAAPADPEVSSRLEIPVLFPVMHVTRTMEPRKATSRSKSSRRSTAPTITITPSA